MGVSRAVCLADNAPVSSGRPHPRGIAPGRRPCRSLDCETFSPDGLTEQSVDELLGEMDMAVLARPRPTSTLLDGTAAERRFRRQARRSVAAVVRALPVRRGVLDPDGQEAA